MSTASKGLLCLLSKLLLPVMQRTVGNAQISGNSGGGLVARLGQSYRFHLTFFRKGALVLWHDLFPSCVRLTLSSLPSTFFWVKTNADFPSWMETIERLAVLDTPEKVLADMKKLY